MTHPDPHAESRFRAVAGALSDAVVILDAEGRLTFANDEVEAVFGHPPADLLDLPLDRVFDPSGVAGIREEVDRLSGDGSGARGRDLELTAVRPDGTRVPVRVTLGAYREQGERFFVALIHDLSERHETEARLRFQARLLDAVGEAVIATDLSGRILYWNAAAEELYGWTADEVLGRPVEEVTPAEVSKPAAHEIMDRLRRGESWTGEFMVRNRAGRSFPVLVTDSPVVETDGTMIGIIGTSMEITERKRIEDAQRFLAETGQVLSSSLDHETTLGRLSRLAVPMLGEWCMVHLLEAGEPEPVAHCAPPGREDQAPTLERLLAGPDGLVHGVLTAAEPVRIGKGDDAFTGRIEAALDALDIRELLLVPLEARGHPLGVLTFGRPSSARRYDEDDLRLAGELAMRAASALDNARLYREAEESDRAKTDFLAVVSHELRTPLNAITGYAELLTGGVSGPLNDKQHNQVERIQVSARHLAQIIDEILTYARMEGGRDTLELDATDVSGIVREAVSVLQPEAGAKGLALTVDAPERGPELRTDQGKLRQIVVNLVANGVKYTETGEVTVTVREVEGGVELTVADSGIGIPADQQERIFEPFRQVQSPNTRTSGGTGLGLSVSLRLAQLMGGTIDVESTPGVGSTFTVRLPDHPLVGAHDAA